MVYAASGGTAGLITAYKSVSFGTPEAWVCVNIEPIK